MITEKLSKGDFIMTTRDDLLPFDTMLEIFPQEQRNRIEANSEIAFQVMEARARLHMLRPEFAAKLGITPEKLIQYENGEVDSLNEVADLFGKLGLSFSIQVQNPQGIPAPLRGAEAMPYQTAKPSYEVAQTSNTAIYYKIEKEYTIGFAHGYKIGHAEGYRLGQAVRADVSWEELQHGYESA
jgi:DNA-binding XRE family transcriptional regulator